MRPIILFTLLALSLWSRIEGSEQEAIKNRTLSYAALFNKKDSKGMALHWAQNASYTNPLTGASVKGRAEIEKQLGALFQELNNPQLKIDITSIELQGKDQAVERGKATLTAPNGNSQQTLFQLTLVKENGQWNISKIDEVDWMDTPTHFDELKDLDWLIGEWIDQSETFEIVSTYKWDEHKNFITHQFSVTTLGNPDMEGKQIIGWDPAQNTVRSWLFDSNGGFAQAKWKKEGNHWAIESASTLPDGRVGSQITVITPIDKNSYGLEITGREIDGEILPNLGPAKIVRKGAK